MAGNQKITTENINEVILRLLNLDPGTELDYQTYSQIIKKKLSSSRMLGKGLPAEEDILLRNEFKRVRNKTGRFNLRGKKTRVSSPPPPPPSPNRGSGGGGGNGPRGGKIVKSPSGKITADSFPQYFVIDPVKVRDVTEKTTKVSRNGSNTYEVLKSPLERIGEKLDSIIGTLTDINKEDKDRFNKERKETENRKRRSKEKDLESKPVSALTKAIGLITKPFQSIIDKIINFVVMTLFGRAMIKLIDWFADPKNKEKIQSIIRFFKDWWPALLGGYILFGTSFGKGIRILSRVAFGGIGKITKLLPLLLKIVKNPLAIGTALFTFGAWGPKVFPGLVNDNKAKPSTVKASGGGHANFGKWFSGLVKGPKGRDKVPAMLTDGEFVMSVGAVQKYGVDTLEAMNAAGGGDNQPKVVSGTTYAAGGGPIGRSERYENKPGNDPVSELRKHFNNFIKSRGAGYNFDIGNPHTWGGKTSPSGGGGTGGFLRGLGYAGNALGQVSRVLGNAVNPTLSYAQRAAGQAGRMINPAVSYAQRAAGQAGKMVAPTVARAQRIAGEAGKMAAPTVARAQRVTGEVKKKADPFISAITGFRPDLSGIQTLGSNIHGAATEAVPALLASTLGISRTDRSISKDMQKALLDARKNALSAGRKNIDYGDYVGGGLSAGGLTFGRIGDDEFKRDSKGRIIGIRQVYDTNRRADEAMKQAGDSFEAFKKSGFKDMSSLGRAVYKPFEALLANVQHRGMTMHDIDFDEKILGFKPGKEVLNPTQKKMIAEQKNREALQNKRPWWDKMGLFGGASAQMAKDQKAKQEFAKKNPGAKLYDKPQKNTGQSYKSKFSRSKPAPTVKPPPKPTSKTTKVTRTQGGRRGSGASPSTNGTQPPRFSPNHGSGTRRTQGVYGVRK